MAGAGIRLNVNARAVKALLKSTGQSMPERVTKALGIGAQLIAGDARRNAPVLKPRGLTQFGKRRKARGALRGVAAEIRTGRGGGLRASITVVGPEIEGTTRRFRIGPAVFYGKFNELGTGLRGRASVLTPLAREWMRELDYVHGAGPKRPNTPGMTARPYLAPAFYGNRDRVRMLVIQAAQSSIPRGAGASGKRPRRRRAP